MVAARMSDPWFVLAMILLALLALVIVEAWLLR
jgi:flagellar biogenesis protein FliO